MRPVHAAARSADGGAGELTVSITVPHADESRNHMLHREWVRQGGEDLPAPPLRLPRRSEGSYTVRIRQQPLADFIVEHQYSDALAGRTGGAVDHRASGIVAHLTVSGEWRFSSGRSQFRVGPGQLLVRDNEVPWDFEIDRGTRSMVLQLPAGDGSRYLAGRAAFAVDQDAPAARLLLAHIRSWASLPGLPRAAELSARAAGLELLRGLLAGEVSDDGEYSAALVQSAMTVIEERLLTDTGLDPAAIAQAVHVSARTLHRAFAAEGLSVMARVRERRLERARAEFLAGTLAVSEIAARWHFTDSSHFIKSYRRQFGDPPAADRRRVQGSGAAARREADRPEAAQPR